MRRRPFSILLAAAAIFVVSLAGWWVRETRLARGGDAESRERHRELQRAVTHDESGPVPLLQVGESAPRGECRSTAGDLVTLEFDGEGPATMLLFFSPDCPGCRGGFSAWDTRTDGEALRRIYLSTAAEEPTRRFARRHRLPDPVLLADPDLLLAYRITHLPTTVLVAASGVIREVWIGPPAEPE